MATSPTQLTLRKWRRAGYKAWVVEKWNSHVKIRQDMFGFIDVVAVGNGETVGIQSTAGGGSGFSNMQARVRKIAEDDDIQDAVAILRDAGWRLIVEGWHKAGNRWQSREVDVS